MKVRNINGTSDNTCKCVSWLNHWKKYGGTSQNPFCACSTCYSSAEVGAHVQKDNALDQAWYIIPLCQKHNLKAESLMIGDSTTLVSANVNKTCGK